MGVPIGDTVRARSDSAAESMTKLIRWLGDKCARRPCVVTFVMVLSASWARLGCVAGSRPTGTSCGSRPGFAQAVDRGGRLFGWADAEGPCYSPPMCLGPALADVLRT